MNALQPWHMLVCLLVVLVPVAVAIVVVRKKR
jgi:hypothetical protein